MARVYSVFAADDTMLLPENDVFITWKTSRTLQGEFPLCNSRSAALPWFMFRALTHALCTFISLETELQGMQGDDGQAAVMDSRSCRRPRQSSGAVERGRGFREPIRTVAHVVTGA